MNPDFEAFSDSVAATRSAFNSWDTAAKDLAAVIDSYQKLEEQNSMQTPPDSQSDFKQLVLCGARSCTLAMMVAASSDSPDLIRIAVAVLGDWGIEHKEEPEPAPSEELVWPPVYLNGRPLAAKLGPAYFKTKYFAHEPLVSAYPNTTTPFTVSPDDPLTLIAAYWDEARYVWRLKFSWSGVPHDFLWVNHCAVRPSEEPDADVTNLGATSGL